MANQMTPQLQTLLRLLQQQQGGGPMSIPVEGGAAQQIIPAKPITPAPMPADLQPTRPTPIAPMPQPRPAMPPAAPVAPPQPRPAPQGNTGGGVSDFFNIDPRLGRMLEGIMGGAAYADPTQPFMKTMGQGFMGARGTRQAREDRKRADIIAQDKEARAARREGRDERRLGLDEKRTRLGALKTATDIEKTLSDIKVAERKAKSLGLTANEVIQIANATNKYMQGEIQRRGGEYRLDDDDRVEIDDAAKEYRADLTRRAQEAATGKKQGRQQPGDEAGGSGTEDDPYRLAPGNWQDAYEALPTGAYFINPSDGKLLRKR